MIRTIACLVAVSLVVVLLAPAGAAAADASVQDECEYPLELTDGTGETVTIEESPERVVTVMPSDAQKAFEIGADDRVVGAPDGPATQYLDLDDQEDVTEADGFTVDAETVVGLEPDVVVAASAADPELIAQLRDLDLTVYQFPLEESVDDVVENLHTMGQLTDECDGAATTADWMDERLTLLEEAVADEEPPLTYYEMGDGFTAGEGTFQHELLTIAGVENLGAEAGIEGWDIVSEETVVDMDPEWFLYGDDFPESPIPESLEETTAGQEGNEIVVNANFFSQPGPLVTYAIEEIVEEVHPEAYDGVADEIEALDAEYEAADEDDADDDADAGETEETDDGEGDDSLTGFGVPVAVGALLALAGWFGRDR